ncbi:hypothetical protein THIX_10614 [Thiomonas sp. X19]|nr:hypothetical protein THIX_10614 [Thiomonas sp. X19]
MGCGRHPWTKAPQREPPRSAGLLQSRSSRQWADQTSRTFMFIHRKHVSGSADRGAWPWRPGARFACAA